MNDKELEKLSDDLKKINKGEIQSIVIPDDDEPISLDELKKIKKENEA